MSTKGRVSPECDILIYDGFRQPQLLDSGDHAMFAADAVFGIIESKSTLSSDELREAHENVRQTKQVADRARDEFFGGIVAFTANRSLDAVARQLAELNKAIPDNGSRSMPNCVAVLDQGLIESLDAGGRVRIMRSGDNTLLHFFIRVLESLDGIDLNPVDFGRYLSLPHHVDGHVVEGHDRYVRAASNGRRSVFKLRDETIRRVYRACQAAGELQLVTEEELQRMRAETWLGVLVSGRGFVYNPDGRTIITREQVATWDRGHAVVGPNELYPQDAIKIDGEFYYVDLKSFEDSDFEENTDVTLGELTWQYVDG